MTRGLRITAAALALAALSVVIVLALWSDGMPSDAVAGPPVPESAIALAVLGDSNSQSYQDPEWFPLDSPERGGALRARTFQWTEVLARLRGQELDPGPWVRWGRPGVVARAREWLGLPGGRAPRKADYRYNFANSGAACRNLMGGRFRQAPRLVALMNESPARWRHGVVVIRIGYNDFGGLVDLQARDPSAPQLRAAAAHCAGEIGAAVALIHASHPQTRILLVGIGNEADDPDKLGAWQSARETANIARALDDFNGAIRQLTVGDPRMAFFDDLAWFRSKWGSRDAVGRPDYKAVAIGSVLRVGNTAGDDPRHAFLGDHHPGLAWNALWAQSLVVRLREAFGLPLTPIADAEIERFLAPLVAADAPRAPGS